MKSLKPYKTKLRMIKKNCHYNSVELTHELFLLLCQCLHTESKCRLKLFFHPILIYTILHNYYFYLSSRLSLNAAAAVCWRTRLKHKKKKNYRSLVKIWFFYKNQKIKRRKILRLHMSKRVFQFCVKICWTCWSKWIKVMYGYCQNNLNSCSTIYSQIVIYEVLGGII